MSKWIHIWYSWGDHEIPIEVPDGEDAWKKALHLAAEEASVSQESIPGEVGLLLEEDTGRIVLRYADGSLCFYEITDQKDLPSLEEILDSEKYVKKEKRKNDSAKKNAAGHAQGQL